MKNFIASFLALTSLTAFAHGPGNNGQAANIGDAVPGLTPQQQALFTTGKAEYQRDFTVADGLGPLFRASSCVACHGGPVVGGQDPAGTTNNVTHFMLNNQGNWMLALEMGGPVQQHHTIAEKPGGEACDISPDVIPPLPGITTSIRHSPPVFGFGLLDAVPDAEILEWQGKKPWKNPAVIGVANWGVELESLQRLRAFTFDITRTQPVGAPRVGRFGWKAQTATLFQFTTEPMNIELGMSTPFFPRENTPNGGPVPTQCRLAGSQPNDTGSQSSVKLYQFQALLGAPPQGPRTPASFYGEFLFYAVGCADCHRPQMKTGREYYMPMADGTAQRVAALENKVIKPYSDLLVHDMGPGLEDGRVMGRASGRFWRTTPLWGIRFKDHYLHDGRATSIHQAIDAHGGESAPSTALYEALNPAQQAALTQFIESL
ncbi:MAG: di-heme oxidoredictase family protein [Myxococcota bacterium]